MNTGEASFNVGVGGERLDRFLAARVQGRSRSQVKDLILRECVQVDGLRRGPDYRLLRGQCVTLCWPRPSWSQGSIEDWVIDEDKDILVLEKPTGLLMHPMGATWESEPESALSEEEPSLAGLLHARRPLLAGSGVTRCGLVHRLDRHTSGVLVVAKNASSQSALLEAFRERTVRKQYRAIVLGTLGAVRVDAPVGRLSGMRRVQVTRWGREAKTDFRPIGSGRGVSLVAAEPKTGRTHQIRAHLAMLGHPVLGDQDWFREKERMALGALGHPEPPRMMLHAAVLSFAHPRTGKKVTFRASPPKDFRDYWTSLKAPKGKR